MRKGQTDMPNYEEVVHALEMCTAPRPNCPDCPYFGAAAQCSLEMVKDALALLKEYGKNG